MSHLVAVTCPDLASAEQVVTNNGQAQAAHEIERLEYALAAAGRPA